MIRVIDAHHLQVGDRTWWGEYSTEGSISGEAKALLSESLGYPFVFERRQFTVQYESGWSVSVVWGSMTYSDNYEHGQPHREQPLNETPELVELGVLHHDRAGIQGGDTMAYCDEDDVNFVLDAVSKLGTTDTVMIRGHLILGFRSH